jgi:hypothetical protein
MAALADLDVPWTGVRAASRVREVLICGVLGPLMDLYTRCHVAGREHLDDLNGPEVFVANHDSHMDTPVILRALPGRRRRHTAVAAADYFYDTRRKAPSRSLAFGIVPLDRNSGAGVGPDHTAPVDRLISNGGKLRVGKSIVPRASERPSEVMERVRLSLAECRAETEREPHAEHTHRRQPA